MHSRTGEMMEALHRRHEHVSGDTHGCSKHLAFPQFVNALGKTATNGHIIIANDITHEVHQRQTSVIVMNERYEQQCKQTDNVNKFSKA